MDEVLANPTLDDIVVRRTAQVIPIVIQIGTRPGIDPIPAIAAEDLIGFVVAVECLPVGGTRGQLVLPLDALGVRSSTAHRAERVWNRRQFGQRNSEVEILETLDPQYGVVTHAGNVEVLSVPDVSKISRGVDVLGFTGHALTPEQQGAVEVDASIAVVIKDGISGTRSVGIFALPTFQVVGIGPAFKKVVTVTTEQHVSSHRTVQFIVARSAKEPLILVVRCVMQVQDDTIRTRLRVHLRIEEMDVIAPRIHVATRQLLTSLEHPNKRKQSLGSGQQVFICQSLA